MPLRPNSSSGVRFCHMYCASIESMSPHGSGCDHMVMPFSDSDRERPRPSLHERLSSVSRIVESRPHAVFRLLV